MREDLLYYVWKNQKFQKVGLRSTANEVVEIITPGQLNTSSGPDFFNARIRIGNQQWAGNVEIHVKSSHWYTHGHETDPNYDSIILHVVWEDDVAIYRKNGNLIPTLSLKKYIPLALLDSYDELLHKSNRKFINCEKDSSTVKDIIWLQWHERLFVERLEQKSLHISSLRQKTKNDWEGILFQFLMKSFGLDKNGEAFRAMAAHLSTSVFKKISSNVLQLESMFFGLAGFLDEPDILDSYYIQLRKEYLFLSHKYRIPSFESAKPVFFGLRPSNFPTIRLSQLAHVFSKSSNLFAQVMDAKNIQDYYDIFQVSASTYWDSHYTFEKESKKSKKTVTKNFVHLLLINAIIPIRFSYNKFLGKMELESLLEVMQQLPFEKNRITKGFDSIGVTSKSAFDSQAKIQLYHNYCKANKCLQCHIGIHLLNRKN